MKNHPGSLQLAAALSLLGLSACNVEFTAPTTPPPAPLAANDFSTIHPNNAVELMQAITQMSPVDDNRVNFSSTSYTGPNTFSGGNAMLGQTDPLLCNGTPGGSTTLFDNGVIGSYGAGDEHRDTFSNCNVGGGWVVNGVSSDIVRADNSTTDFTENLTFSSTNHTVIRAISGSGYANSGGGSATGTLKYDSVTYGVISSIVVTAYPDDGRMNPGWTMSGSWRSLPVNVAVTLSATTYTFTLTTSADSSKMVATVPDSDSATISLQVTDKRGAVSTLTTTKAQMITTALSAP